MQNCIKILYKYLDFNKKNMWEENRVNITIREEWFKDKLDILQNIYNLKTYSALIQSLVEAELRRQGIVQQEFKVWKPI